MPNEIERDTLFIACTRPPMLWGVPMQGAIANGCLIMVVFILLKNPLYLMIWPATHWAMRLVVSRDYNMFGVWSLWLRTKGRALDVARWGGSSVSPLPIKRARRISEVRVHV